MNFSFFLLCVVFALPLSVEQRSNAVTGTYSLTGRGFGVTLNIDTSGDFRYVHREPAPNDAILYEETTEGTWRANDSVLTLAPTRTQRNTGGSIEEMPVNADTVFWIVRDPERNVTGIKSKLSSQILEKEL